MKYKNNAGEIENSFINISKEAFDIYMLLNPKEFTSPLIVDTLFKDSLENIIKAHNQKVKIETHVSLLNNKVSESKKVLLAFSGGLDSMYQALVLKEQGYEVILFHVKNINYYTNGKELQVSEEFAKLFSLPLVIASFKQNIRSNEYKKYWKENSFKNILIYSMMVDYCIENSISNISSGDDLRLDIKDAVVGTNIADAKQVTLPFMNSLNYLTNIKFIPTQNTHKGIRLAKLIEYKCLDLFYSCVNPGRFNQCNHNRIQEKFSVNIEKYNCGVCRKCAFHSLLRYYYLNEDYSKEFINFCWQKISNGADYEFFKPDLPLEIKIKNLYDY